MAHESFENEDIAEYLNENFVSIKVDREERPDVDRVYMAFVQAFTHHGGWPMSVFLTPDLKPFFGGTYFPPEDKYGRPGFKTILQRIAKLWNENREALISQSDQIMQGLQQHTGEASASGGAHSEVALQQPDKYLKLGAMKFMNQFDNVEGGFGDAPKFPRPSILNYLFRVYHMYKESDKEMETFADQILRACLLTLDKMANGGLKDHVGGGFHRYSVDEEWHVPHFEKMLYDQSQLVYSYLDAYVATGNEFYADIARETLSYVQRIMSNGDAFFSAEDADSKPTVDATHGVEGAFYVYEYKELKETISGGQEDDTLKMFCELYDCRPGGNVKPTSDPHGELKNKNHLIQRKTFEEVAKNYNRTTVEVQQMAKDALQKLLAFRQKRPRPHLDDKILVSWNGLMLGAFAKAGAILDNMEYIDVAEKCARFMRDKFYTDNGILMHSYRETIAPIEGYLNDYAFLIHGLLDLYEATGRIDWLEWAQTLQEKQNELFWDKKNHGYFEVTGKDKSILLRMKENYDGAEPAGSSVSAMNLARLGTLLGAHTFTSMAEQCLAQNEYLSRAPHAAPHAACALHQVAHSGRQFALVLPENTRIRESQETRQLLHLIQNRLDPAKSLMFKDEFIGMQHEYLKDATPKGGKSTVYLCEHGSCQQPVNSVEGLKKLLHEE